MELVPFDGVGLEVARGEVMIPRSTSERLVAAACERIHGPARVADVGTGSGALAIAIAVRRPQVEVWATDADGAAVALARANVDRLALGGRVIVRSGDLLEAVPGALDVIVANLPYLAAHSSGRYPDLAAEPFDAVFAAGDGLDHYRRLLPEAALKLAPRGTLLLQLHGEVLLAERSELSELRERLKESASAADDGHRRLSVGG